MKVQPNQGRTVFSVTFASGVLQVGSASQGGHEDIGVAFFHELVAQTYKFNAERFNIGVSPVGTSRVLNPDASNLPEVLDNLKENPARFEEYVALVREVLPPVKGISLRPVQTNRVEILIWLVDPRSKRIDLAIPLAQCGTGIGQVLSILYVVTTSLTPKTLCVDEPQSFLHPGAARKLIEILKRHRQHQYFITTHSPTVITTAGTVPMTLLTANEGVTTIEQLDPSAADSMRRSLLELGARLADVFGADNVLWVEGPTEELCFPKIVERVLGRSILGTAIVAVARTGDLEGRNAERVLRIYNRLARANHMIPPALAFLIDRECRSNDEMLELKRLNEGKTFFLKRRMLENYLLNPDAIVAVVNEIEGFSPRPITTDLVNAVLEKSKSIAGLYCNKKINQPQWMTDIHAAEVLAEVFRNLSENRVEFRKTTHSVAILDWIIVNSPDDITELSSSLAEALQVSS